MTPPRTAVWLALLALSSAATRAQDARSELPVVDSQTALRRLAQDGFLGNVRIAGDLDLAKLQAVPGSRALTLRGVEIDGKLRASGEVPPIVLQFEEATLAGIDLDDARLAGSLVFEGGHVRGPLRFTRASIEGPFVIHGTELQRGAAFRAVRFRGPVEITDVQFLTPAGATGLVSFADAGFGGPATFNRNRFTGGVRFDSSRFERDASFLSLEAPGTASFRNVMFDRDAEFRSCRFGATDFGDERQMSVFAGLADFRGCSFESLSLDFADVRGDLMLVNARVGPGALSLRNAVLRGTRSDFSGIRLDGPLELEGAYVTAMHFRWHDLAPALARSPLCSVTRSPGPNEARCSDVIRPLQRRLTALGQDDDAREASAALADHLSRERLALDDLGVGERGAAWVERILWGHGTAYGTRIGRIAGIALIAWLLLAAPIWLGRGIAVGRWAGKPSEVPARHRAIAADLLQTPPPSALDRWLQRLGFSVGVMFATPGLQLRAALPARPGLEAYLLVLRGIGGVLLALLALTLANVSPIIRAIIGTIAR